jgi:hypothetical protein
MAEAGFMPADPLESVRRIINSYTGKHLSFMPERKPKQDFIHIGRIIGDVLKEFMPESGGGLSRVWQLWDDVVGAAIAANARPAAFKGDLLLVHVTSSTWIHQLQFLKADIISKLNAALGKPMITEIKFKIGPLA